MENWLKYDTIQDFSVLLRTCSILANILIGFEAILEIIFIYLLLLLAKKNIGSVKQMKKKNNCQANFLGNQRFKSLRPYKWRVTTKNTI